MLLYEETKELTIFLYFYSPPKNLVKYKIIASKDGVRVEDKEETGNVGTPPKSIVLFGGRSIRRPDFYVIWTEGKVGVMSHEGTFKVQ